MTTTKYFAPGRINLIGEHLDYNGGLVLPAALTVGITLSITKRNDNKIILRSATHSSSMELDAGDNIEFDKKNDWANYPLGVIAQLKKEGYSIPGCELFYESNLPEGSGLSSSAAIEVLTGYALIGNATIDRIWLANFCRQVENDFIGMKCGVMDQYAVALGLKDNAILIDCEKLTHSYIPVELNDYRLIIMDTKKPRSLIQSKYNERREQCEAALKIINATQSEVKNLCDAQMFHLDLLHDETLKKRARHVISEMLRVKESVKTLKFNDLSTFGRLMNASHASLKNDFEVSGPELNILAEEAQQIKGCTGARMTGGGFAGCAIAFVHQTNVEELKNKVGEIYLSKTGINAAFYESEIGDGVREI